MSVSTDINIGDTTIDFDYSTNEKGIVYFLYDNQFIEFGVAQIPYDYTRTLDESLDNLKIQVQRVRNILTPTKSYKFNGDEILNPSTIVKLDGNYWYVNKDTLSKKGGIYYNSSESLDTTQKHFIHTILLDELTQVLNDRFIDDCAFSQDRYKIEEAINRLFKLSDTTDIDVDYSNINTETYIPKQQFKDSNLFNALSSMCRYFDRFPRLSYNEETNRYILSFDYLGVNYDDRHLLSEITDIDIKKEMSRNSNATKVISNAYNTSSQEWVYYPNRYFGKYMFPDDYGTEIKSDYSNVKFTTPSNIREVGKVTLFPQITLIVWEMNSDTETGLHHYTIDIPSSGETLTLDAIKSRIETIDNFSSSITKEKLSAFAEELVADAKGNVSFTLDITDGDEEPVTGICGEYELGEFYLREKKQYDLLSHTYVFDALTVDKKEMTIYWEQGSNYIKGFNSRVYQSYSESKYKYTQSKTTGALTYLEATISLNFALPSMQMSVQYIPQDDLKLVRTNNDDSYSITKMYNQSENNIDYGRLGNSMQNYINEMQSKDFTINAYYESVDDIINVGSILYDDTNDYVITSESITYRGSNSYEVIYQLNERYVKRNEFIGADDDIRDYDIPQNNIVNRKKVINAEITFSYESGTNTLPFPLTVYSMFGHRLSSTTGVTSCFYDLAGIKVVFEDDETHYFILPVTPFISSTGKSVYFNIKIDDNYLIGQTRGTHYTAKNTIVPWLQPQHWADMINQIITNNQYYPIRYTDLNGEIKDISISFLRSIDLKDYGNDLQVISMFMPSIDDTISTCFAFDELISEGMFGKSSTYKNKCNIDLNDFLKDKYEKIQIGLQVNYKGDNGIEICDDIVSNRCNPITGNGNNTIDNCYVRLYKKSTYKYLNQEKYNKIKDDTSLYSAFQCKEVTGDTTYRQFYLDTGLDSIPFENYILVICSQYGSPYLILNNNNFEDGTDFTLYMNGRIN